MIIPTAAEKAFNTVSVDDKNSQQNKFRGNIHNMHTCIHTYIEKEIKGVQIGKGEAKLSPFAENRILHIENPKDPTKTPLELINEFSRVTGYKNKVQKLVTFLFTKNKLSE